MADYNRSEAYDYSFYGAPAVNPAYEEEQQYTAQPQRKPRKKKALNIRRETLASAVQTLRIIAIAVTLISLFAAVLYSRATLAVLEKNGDTLASQIRDAESENTRLVMLLNSSVSREKVDEYAVSVLGMQKLERFQIHYFADKTGDRVVMANGAYSETDIEADKSN